MKYLLLLLCILVFRLGFTQDTAKAPTACAISNVDTANVILQQPISNNNKVFLQWTVDKDVNPNAFFLIERSIAGNAFETLATIKANKKVNLLKYTDEQPLIAGCYYRVSYVNDTTTSTSNAKYISVPGANFSCKFYPNPVENMLIIRADAKTVVDIVDRSGNTIINNSLNAGVNVIDVSTLQKGAYFIKFTQTLTGKRFTDELVKH